jgi:hypothetical protein
MSDTIKCDLCGHTVNSTIECEKSKNGYCAVFLLRAEESAKKYNMHPRISSTSPESEFTLKTTNELNEGDTFRYIGAMEDDLHIVLRKDETKFYYNSGYNKEDSNVLSNRLSIEVKNRDFKKNLLSANP